MDSKTKRIINLICSIVKGLIKLLNIRPGSLTVVVLQTVPPGTVQHPALVGVVTNNMAMFVTEREIADSQRDLASRLAIDDLE